MAGTFNLQIVTPEREILNAAVQQVSLPGMAGSFGVMRNHAPIVAALEPGALDIRDADNGELHLSIGGGFFQMMDNQAIVLADSAENASDINIERAREAEERAKARLAGQLEPEQMIERQRAETALKRARARMRIAGK